MCLASFLVFFFPPKSESASSVTAPQTQHTPLCLHDSAVLLPVMNFQLSPHIRISVKSRFPHNFHLGEPSRVPQRDGGAVLSLVTNPSCYTCYTVMFTCCSTSLKMRATQSLQTVGIQEMFAK